MTKEEILNKYNKSIENIVNKYGILYPAFKDKCLELAETYSKENSCSINDAILKLCFYQIDEENQLLFLSILI